MLGPRGPFWEASGTILGGFGEVLGDIMRGFGEHFGVISAPLGANVVYFVLVFLSSFSC